MNRIFILGLTSSALGGMEFHNLGNYIIMEPFIYYLKKEFPDAVIHTSIQMSDQFCKKYGITSLRDQRFWTYGKLTAYETAKDIIKIAVWKIAKMLFNKDWNVLIKSSPLLTEFKESDFVIDFSGDIFGDNANYCQFLEDCAEILMGKILGKPVAMLIGSPGPFKKKWRQILGRFILNKIDLITNREPISTELMRKYGVSNPNMFSTACPGFLFEAPDKKEVLPILEKEGLVFEDNKPLIGLIVCGWNMPLAPFNKLPRENLELEPFVDLLKHLVTTLNTRVLLFSHQNRTDKQGNLVRGNDHAIIDQIYTLINDSEVEKNVLRLKGLYNARECKGIISQCNMLISGRIHGAVNGLSQCIPTVILDYGHEPKAHKLKGFALNVGLEKYLANPSDSQDMIAKVSEVWENRDEIHSFLCKRIPKVQRLALSNFKMLRQFLYTEES